MKNIQVAFGSKVSFLLIACFVLTISTSYAQYGGYGGGYGGGGYGRGGGYGNQFG